jgi:hypothetical protein
MRGLSLTSAVVIGCLFAVATGFTLPTTVDYGARNGFKSLSQSQKHAFGNLILRKNHVACRGAPQDLPQAKDLIGVGDESTIEDWFAKLGDSRQSIRTLAGMKIAEFHDAEGQVLTKHVDFRNVLYLIALHMWVVMIRARRSSGA